MNDIIKIIPDSPMDTVALTWWAMLETMQRCTILDPTKYNLEHAEVTLDNLLRMYQGPGRHYHNLIHINKMLQDALLVTHLISSPYQMCELVYSIILHDAVYIVKPKGDSEQASGLLAVEVGALLGMNPNFLSKVYQNILATKHDGNNLTDGISRLFVDIDLKILAAPWDEFSQATADIRQEYDAYTDYEFYLGRMKFLKHMLDKESTLYKTVAFKDSYEEKARSNLQDSFNRLSRMKFTLGDLFTYGT